ncbi:MAG TPA: quinolinate synthase NadA [Smithellaceae bacterium]|nr:quinolinate synthase NadA [Smithellaceae bacterium]
MNSQQKKIRELLKERRAILLVHYYQRPEIQEIADVLGDSLALSMAAAKNDAAVIVFAGVHFMAQSAALLAPDKTVLLPRPDAGCPLADMASVESVQKMKSKEHDACFVTYINSTAEVKAASDVCCTSSNAVAVVNSVKDKRKIIMLPDGNLARWVSRQTDKEIIAWPGYCPVHHFLKAADVAAKKRQYPSAPFAAHPECPAEILALADFVGSTGAILQFARTSSAPEIIIGTEEGILTELQKQNPGKKFIMASPQLVCHDMKKTTLDDIEKSLVAMQPVITVPEEIRASARRALDGMLAVS